MRKEFLFTGIGIITICLSVLLFYLFITSLDNGGNIILFIGFFVTASVTVFSFIQATKPAPTIDESTIAIKPENGGMEGVVQKNNQMVKEFTQTAKAREELRMLELAGSKKEA